MPAVIWLVTLFVRAFLDCFCRFSHSETCLSQLIRVSSTLENVAQRVTDRYESRDAVHKVPLEKASRSRILLVLASPEPAYGWF